MTSSNEKSGFPLWMLAVIGGGLVGVIACAIIIFGGAPKGGAGPADSPAGQSTSGGPAQSISSSGNHGTLASVPKTAEEWTKSIDSADSKTLPALLDAALAMPDPAERKEVIQKLVAKWLNTDSPGFLDYLDDLEASEDGGENAWPILVPPFIASLQNLTDEAAADPDVEEAVLWMTEYYAEQDPAGAAAWAKGALLGDVQEEALSTIVGELAVQSLDQAVALAREIGDANAQLDGLANIGAVLGEKKPQEALRWAQSLTDPNERQAVLDEVLWSMSYVDPEMAARELANINEPELIASVGSSIAEELASKDPMGAVRWANGLPAGDARSEAMAGALAGWATNDAKAAYEYLRTNASGNGDATEWVFEEWGAQSPTEATSAIASISDDAQRERAIIGLVNGWLYEEDTQGVEQWVDQLPAGKERDAASAAIVDALSFDEPQPAWERALTISDPQIRQEAVLSAFSGLADGDEAAARAALNSPQLTDEDRELLRPMVDDSAPPMQLQ